MRNFLLAIALFFTVSLPSMVNAKEVYTPQQGDPERTAILNAVRPILEVRLGKPIEFFVSWLRVYDGWAFAAVNPQRPGGGQIDPHTPVYEPWEHQDGLQTVVLLKHDYGQWNVVEFAIGPTDAYWEGLPLYQQFPKAFLFGQ
nr:hypothetical protein [uncultured Cohaesibacter sp.]